MECMGGKIRKEKILTYMFYLLTPPIIIQELTWWLSSKESAYNAGDTGDIVSSIPESGRSPGEGNGNSLQYSYLENPTDRGAWWATVHSITESDTTEMTEQAHMQGYLQMLK